jgi:hypothetical protein
VLHPDNTNREEGFSLKKSRKLLLRAPKEPKKSPSLSGKVTYSLFQPSQNHSFSGPTNTSLHTAPRPVHCLAFHRMLIGSIFPYRRKLHTRPGFSNVVSRAVDFLYTSFTAIKARSLSASTGLPAGTSIPIAPGEKQPLAPLSNACSTDCQTEPLPLPIG